ncbi:hypothetical protein M3616_19625 [Bacillus velezensis]|uniref:hypothetical protein n=2 Tax=Bacillus subtilis group TaxID=653685 RepID=UPI000CF049A7|nr:hypothetical protein [Bacillus velezensis]MCM3278290.1 hypothetical protein [Bacillus velezensis]MCM3351410.1 hypothetical protein [Bacillus velezensis]MCV4328521.1 hypothetical protein [Bacillus velezensis]PQB09417.1 hypothetical protein C5O26_21875 [Bacillus velezensis]WEV83572.1 hypothetical protein L0P93_10230 [Bacillus velezensis]
MMLIKQKGNRYYRYSWAQMRSFPIKKVEALELIENGEAELVESFITDPAPQPITEETKQVDEVQEEVKSTKVVSIKSMIEAKKAKDHFVKRVLPKLNLTDIKKLTKLSFEKDSEGFQEEIMRIILRLDIEEATVGCLQGGQNT